MDGSRGAPAPDDGAAGSPAPTDGSAGAPPIAASPRVPAPGPSACRAAGDQRARGPVTLLVCVTCRAGEPVEDGRPVAGARLLEALLEVGAPAGVRIVGVECLSACANGASVALTGPGRWAYVYGRMTEADAADILDGAGRYADTPDGLTPWRERPEIFRKRSLARLPPIPAPETDNV